MLGWLRERKRKQWAAEPFPAPWLAHLQANVPFFKCLQEPSRTRFLGMVTAFVHEKHWFGAGGLEVDDEMRVTIAAAAVRLVLHMDLSAYDDLTEIVIYPGAYKHPRSRDGDDDDGVILGEAHTWGTVVLSWQAVLSGLGNPNDGHDTATHEFAHVLDIESGAFNGTPRLRHRDDYRPWAIVLDRHFQRLRGDECAERKVLRAYGKTNEAEFFAVATEAFFEKPRRMKRHLPDLYEVLAELYRLDTADDGHDGAPTGTCRDASP